jgi:2-isopropylmalate synthase
VIPVRRVEVEKNLRAGKIAGEAEGAFAVRGRNREHAPQSAVAVGRRGGVRAQGRRARQRRAETRASYEHIDPSLVGNARNVLISDLAGRSNIVMKAQELGFKLTNDTPELKPILERASRNWKIEGYEYEAAEGSLALLIGNDFEASRTAVQRGRVSRLDAARRKGTVLRSDRQSARRRTNRAQTVAEGDGPVNALDGALRLALAKFFPQLKAVTLTDYKVRILDTATGTAAKTRVLIQSTDGKREWGTVGVSENIIEASLQALVDSMEYALLKKFGEDSLAYKRVVL